MLTQHLRPTPLQRAERRICSPVVEGASLVAPSLLELQPGAAHSPVMLDDFLDVARTPGRADHGTSSIYRHGETFRNSLRSPFSRVLLGNKQFSESYFRNSATSGPVCKQICFAPFPKVPQRQRKQETHFVQKPDLFLGVEREEVHFLWFSVELPLQNSAKNFPTFCSCVPGKFKTSLRCSGLEDKFVSFPSHVRLSRTCPFPE